MATDASRLYEPREMSFSDRRALERAHFATTKAVATARLVQQTTSALSAEQERVQARIAHTNFRSRDALQVYVTYERLGRAFGGHLTSKDYDEVRAIVSAIWPAYAAARGMAETDVAGLAADVRTAHLEAST